MIESSNSQLSIRRQCELLGLNRSSFYYEPAKETIENLRLMRRIDEQYLKTPFFGSRRMAIVLASEGEEVNRKRVKRLMGLMGLEAIHPGPRTTVHNPDHKVYPYLLRGVKVERRDQVWSSDITYIPMHQGFMYLTAVIDWYSRYVLSWSLSNSLDGRFCLETLEEALRGGKPEIFNTDQGVQYTARSFTGRLESAGVSVSMDGRGRALDNVFVERLVAVFEIRGGLSEGLPERGGVGVGADELVPVLQRARGRIRASSTGRQPRSIRRPGEAQDEPRKVGTITKKSGSVV